MSDKGGTVRHRGDTRGLAPVSRETLQAQVYSELRRALMGGVFAPGETVSLRQLAEIFGTSVTPAREAVNRLLAERALALLPNRSVIVPEMTRERFEDLTAARLLLEAHATRLACRVLRPAEIDKIELQNKGIISRLRAGDNSGALAANRDFHFMIYESAGSEVLTHLIEGIWLRVGPFLVLSMELPDATWTTEHHQTLIHALRERNARAAVKALIADIKGSADQLLKVGVFTTHSQRSFRKPGGLQIPPALPRTRSFAEPALGSAASSPIAIGWALSRTRARR
jgi:DNA-binding GntR family transcriptional regulator